MSEGPDSGLSFAVWGSAALDAHLYAAPSERRYTYSSEEVARRRPHQSLSGVTLARLPRGARLLRRLTLLARL